MELVTQRLLSPAKINLMLRILGQRADGYHQLQTCFQILNWGDQMQFEPRPDYQPRQIEISGFGELEKEDNIIFKAAQLLKPWAVGQSAWHIDVEKNIPLGAGLGGGSSNAATTLKFLNQAWQCDLSTFDLLAMAIKLGADVPIFILGQGALATGIGEELSPMSFDSPYVLLLIPDCHVNTAELFSHPSLNRNQINLKLKQIQQRSFWINDFFPVVLQKFPQINSIYQALKGQIDLRLSGSGGVMFALFDEVEEAEAALQLARTHCQAFLVQPNDVSDQSS
ncbi:MAG: 4-(cytidine 5'-diphospho)-2-C-methyl-D-erythritol kinase [Marinicella sp.]